MNPTKSLQYIGLCALVGFAGGGCGRDERIERTDQAPIVEELISLNPPSDHYFLADIRCQTSAENFKSSELATHRLTSAGVQPIDVKIEGGWRSGKSVSSAAVSATIFGRTYERECDQTTVNGRQCADSFGDPLNWTFSPDDTRYLRICAIERFNRESFEGVGSAAIAGVEKARSSIIRSTKGRVVPEPVIVEVLPTYRSILKGGLSPGGDRRRISHITYIANNLFYSPTSKTISVFPETEYVYQKLVSGEIEAHLWESSFVLAHEYGHHVEAIIAAASAKSLSKTMLWSPFTHQFELTDTAVDSEALQYLRIMRGALSEGFADLVAFFSEQADVTAMSQLPTLAVERDPTSLQFADGNDKILDPQYVAALTDPESIVEKTPHRIGAIFAYAIAKEFGAMANRAQIAATETRTVEDIQLDELVVWFARFHQLLAAAAQPNQTISPSEFNQILTLSLQESLARLAQLVPTTERDAAQSQAQTIHSTVLSGLETQLQF